MGHLGRWVVCILVLGVACSESPPATGTETAPCYPNGTCNAGLTCLSDLCVSRGIPDAAVDAMVLPDAGLVDASVPDAAPSDAAIPGAGSPDATLDASPVGPCNPVTNSGCDPGDKCTVITDATTMLPVTGCAREGTVLLGEPCMLDTATGADNCVAQSLCSNGNCREICSSSPDTCGASGVCSQFGGLFEDLDNTGLCSPICDPVAQDCTGDQGCFVDLARGVATCQGQTAEGTAGVRCAGPDSSPIACWVNGCAAGFVPFLDNPTGGRDLCTPFCRPIDADSTNFDVNRLGDPAGITCPVSGWVGGISAANISCRYLGSIYSNVHAGPDVGVCLDVTGDFGATGTPIGSCSAQTPGINDPSLADPGNGKVWVAGCLLEP